MLELPTSRLTARGERTAGGGLVADLSGERVLATVVRRGRELTVFLADASHRLELQEFEQVQDEEAGGGLTAPMPGNVIDVLVEPGQQVEKGRALMIIEAMKMEHTIVAPARGRVAEVCFVRGDQVKEGDQLVAFETDEEAKA